MYRLIYYSDFRDISNNAYRVEILKDQIQAVTAQRLLLADNPVVINYDGGYLYKPLKQSSCSINVLTSELLTDLYTGRVDEIKVRVKKNNLLLWTGYLTPNVYNSEYNSDYDLLTLECIDTIAQLENTKFTKDANLVSSFLDVITRALDKVDKDKEIGKIYLHSALRVNGKDDILKTFYIQERNFYDEDDEPQTDKSVLEDIVTYLSMSMFQYMDSYYLIDYNALASGNNLFIEYDRQTNTNRALYIYQDMRSINAIGVAQTNGSMSLDSIYNKVNVISVNNPVSDILPGLFDEGTLTNQNTDPNKYYETIIGDDVYLSAYFKSDKWATYQPVIADWMGSQVIGELTSTNVNDVTAGSFFQRNDYYNKKDGEPSSLSWDNVVTLKKKLENDFGDVQFKALATSVEYVVYKKGYFIIDLQYLFNNSSFSNRIDEDKDILYRNDKFTTDFHNTKFLCKLKIGDYYYNGESWLSWTKDYLPYKDLYENAIIGVEISGSERRYYYMYNGYKTYITEEEAKKMEAKDRFYLVHVNKVGDPVYNTWKGLTNQVSYKDNLIDSQDGVLIPLPENVLNGKLEFELYAPNDLGSYANPSTEGQGQYKTFVSYCHIKDLKLVYTNNKYYTDIFNQKEFDPDTLYTNDVEGITLQMDDVEMKVNTYTDTASSYSYVIYPKGQGFDFVEDVYIKKYAESMKMEEAIVRRNVERFSVPRYIYSNDLNNRSLTPYTIIIVKGRYLVLNDLQYNLSDDSVSITALEL